MNTTSIQQNLGIKTPNQMKIGPDYQNKHKYETLEPEC